MRLATFFAPPNVHFHSASQPDQ
jgi:hypothetical protein